MKSLLTILFVAVNIFTTYSQDTINVPEDYTTIQSAIDASSNGDIVLVAEGIYYENINYNGKAITVASHFIQGGNRAHIENTIIDGSNPSHPDTGSVVLFVSGEDTNSVLCGFTITGGTGTNLFFNGANRNIGGGICIVNSSVTIKNNIVEFNVLDHPGDVLIDGGGICALSEDSSNYIIENNVIRNNSINSVSTTYVCQGAATDSACNAGAMVRLSSIFTPTGYRTRSTRGSR